MEKLRPHAQVRALFTNVREGLGSLESDAWLGALEERAISAEADWHAHFAGYVRGLAAAGKVSKALAEQWLDQSVQCPQAGLRGEHIVLVTLWTILITLVTLCWQSRQLGAGAALCGAIVVGLTASVWIYRAGLVPSYDGRAVGSTFKRISFTLVFAALTGVLGVFLPGLLGLLMQQAAYDTFTRQQRSFASDPNGLEWIATFAKTHFDADVVLAPPVHAFRNTSLQLIGSSPAFMNTGGGLCELTMSRESLLNSFVLPQSGDLAAWERGVMVHELTHCLDIRRDFRGPSGAWSSVLSIAPADRSAIRNSKGYYRVAADQLGTQLWREAIADIAAVAYWRLNTDRESAADFIRTLRKKRLDDSSDGAHATMCWIDAAEDAAPPARNGEIFEWADRLRSASRCPARITRPS